MCVCGVRWRGRGAPRGGSSFSASSIARPFIRGLLCVWLFVLGSSSSLVLRFFVSIVDVVVLGFLCVSVRRWRNAKRKQKRKRSHGDEERKEEEEEEDDDDDEDEDDNENGRRKNDNTSETTKGKTGRRGVASFVVVVDLHLFHVWNGKKKTNVASLLKEKENSVKLGKQSVKTESLLICKEFDEKLGKTR